jgi:hypothetical protein
VAQEGLVIVRFRQAVSLDETIAALEEALGKAKAKKADLIDAA